MSKFIKGILWVVADGLVIFGVAFFPSLFSICCFISAIVFAPIKEWQDIIKKYIKKPIRTAIIALCIALVLGLFPFTEMITGIIKLFKAAPAEETTSIVYKEESPEPSYPSYFDVESSDTSSNAMNSSSETTTSSISSNKATTSTSHSHSSSPSQVSSNTTSSSQSSKTQKIQSTYKKSTATSTNAKTYSENENSQSVYRTPSGKRYHESETCGGKNSYKISLDDAKSQGLTPCKKCVK